MKSWWKWALGVVAALVLAAASAIGLHVAHFNSSLAQSLPMIEGEAKLPGADGAITIVRDQYGVPHIFATTNADLARAMGFVHAQDRFTQMDATRRAMRGTLSEIFGSQTFKVDARARTMGWLATAEAQLNAASPEARMMIEAYAQGVNAALSQMPTPPEYAFFRAKPAPWAPVDSMLASLAMTDGLTGGEHLDRARARLAKVLTPEQIAQFLSEYPDWAARSYRSDDVKGAISAATQTLENDKPGSNAWVVAGARTKSGKPILANDPHLPLNAPGPFYLSRLEGPDGPMIGASLPGAPTIVIGRTNVLAWGTTTHQIDAADDVPLTPDMAVTETTETINIVTFGLFRSSRTITVKRTPLGPVLDNALFGLDDLYGDKEYVLRTIADDGDNGVAEAVFRGGKAKTVDQYFEALQPWTAPPQNLVVADTQGNIGLISPARYPMRDANGAWLRDTPNDVRILSKNPKEGFFATANNLQTPKDFPIPMPGGHDPYRVTRMNDVLAADPQHTLEATRDLQLDRHSVLAIHMKSAIKAALPQTPDGRKLQTILNAWDGIADAKGIEATLFAYWTRALGAALYRDELGEETFEKFLGPRDAFLDAVMNGALPATWCDDVASKDKVETCPDIAGRALDEAGAALIKERGKDEKNWVWGDVHAARFPNLTLGAVPFIGKGLAVEFPFGGNSTTVNVARNWHTRADYNTVHAAGMRMIVDFADLNGARFMVTPGQSGHPRSPHYGDLAPLWARGEYFELRSDWTPETPPAGAKVLRLSPK
jgi:penicillin amidase